MQTLHYLVFDLWSNKNLWLWLYSIGGWCMPNFAHTLALYARLLVSGQSRSCKVPRSFLWWEAIPCMDRWRIHSSVRGGGGIRTPLCSDVEDRSGSPTTRLLPDQGQSTRGVGCRRGRGGEEQWTVPEGQTPQVQFGFRYGFTKEVFCIGDREKSEGEREEHVGDWEKSEREREKHVERESGARITWTQEKETLGTSWWELVLMSEHAKLYKYLAPQSVWLVVDNVIIICCFCLLL